MKDYLLEIVQHTLPLGLDMVKVTGTDTSTIVEAVSADCLVIMKAQFANPVPEFKGTFGLPNLGKLSSILNSSEFREDAVLSLTTKTQDDGSKVFDGVLFENKDDNFKVNYRFMAANIVAAKIKSVTEIRKPTYQLDIEPTVSGIMRMKNMSGIYNEHTVFAARTNNGDLRFAFGDPSSHAGDFVFHTGVTGTATRPWNWPVTGVQTILGMSGDKRLRIADNDGLMEITVNSGLGTYVYLLPSHSK